MNFAIVQQLDTKSVEKSYLVQNISNNLELFLKDKNYGADIETFYIGFVCVKTKLGYETWFKERKPRYVGYRVTKNCLTGEPMEAIKQYSYDIKIDYELYDEYISASEEVSKKLLAQKILESFVHFDKLPKKVRDFDKEIFKTDVKNFFKEQNLL